MTISSGYNSGTSDFIKIPAGRKQIKLSYLESTTDNSEDKEKV